MRVMTTSRRQWSVVLTAAFLLIAGCAGTTEGPSNDDRAPAAQEDDSFLDGIGGKGDSAYDIEEGSPKAQTLLDFVNTASLTKLDDDVSLDVRAAENIVSARSDADIKTLAELDAIDWVGSRAFRKLYNYCQNNGIFDGSDGSKFVHGIETGSSTAIAILDVVNTASRSTLDSNVGLDTRAASNIVNHRQSGDIETLSELDGIDWVSARAFSKLATYANSNDDGSVPKDSARALGAFEVANTASESTLDDTVGLDSRAATNIISHRTNGGGTENGNKIESIKELDSVHWVGKASIRKLADYAEAKDMAPEVYHGIPVSSRRATGILRIANDRAEHEFNDDLGLDSRAAANLVDFREGHDGVAGTSDDKSFENVEQLAGVSYVAQSAFDKLLTEARDAGTIPAQTWRDVLPTGRIETTLGTEAVTCQDEYYNGSFTAHTGGGHPQPRPLEEGGRYRMFGDNPGRISIKFRSNADSDAYPDQKTIDIADNGTFSGDFENGGYTWDELSHWGRITRSGRMFVTLRAQLDPFDYNGDVITCKLELTLPN